MAKKNRKTTHYKHYLVNGVSHLAEGFYKVAVVDAATDKVVWEMPEFKKNLILNQGMDEVATRTWVDCYRYGICGTGTRPNSVDSSTDTAAQSGTTVTNTGVNVDFTSSAAVGDMIHWDNGSEARITVVTDTTHVTVTPSQTVSGQHYVIYKTAQVGLQTETKRSNSYLSGTGNCGSTVLGTTIQGRRTYDFTTEVGSVSYTEVGVGWATSGATNVFSRILLPSPVPLISGQKLRLVYQLNITLSPSTANAKSLPVGGWPVAPSTDTHGSEQIQKLCITVPDTNGGNNVVAGVFGCLDPGCTNGATTGRSFAISTDATALQAFGSSVQRATNVTSLSVSPTNASYTSLSFQQDVTGVFQVAEANFTTLRSLMMGDVSSPSVFPWSATTQAFVFLFDQNQTKTNVQTLSFTVRMTWGRVLA